MILRLQTLTLLFLSLGGQSLPPIEDVLVRGYRPFVMPSESMLPTIEIGDRLSATMQLDKPLSRGELVLVKTRGTVFVERVAALPGDRFAMKDGVVILNGRRISQTDTGVSQISQASPNRPGRILEEQFPGEAKAHRVLDLGPTSGDDYPEIVLPEGQYFLLGDNRDNSADSRFGGGASGDFGLGLVRRDAIVGLPKYIYWRKRMGSVLINL